MYRQFLAVLALATFLCPALNAALKTQQLEQALEQAASQVSLSNNGVMNDNILLTSEVNGYATSDYAAPIYMIGKIGCKAYALAPNWIITSATCPLSNITSKSFEMLLSDDEIYTLSNLEVTGVFLNNHEVYNPQIFANKHVLLLYLPQSINPGLTEVCKRMKRLKLIAFNQPKNIFTLNALGKFYVHSSRLGWLVKDKTKANIQANSLQGNIFSASSLINGTATDPLFYVDRTSNEYLVAFNMAEESLTFSIAAYWDANPSWDGKNSDKYKSLTPKDFEFIRNIVLKHDNKSWNFIRQSLYLNYPGNLFFK